MLKGLDDVPWSSLTHAYGSASDTPEFIRQLTSPDQQTYQEAAKELFGSLNHQGDIYQASAYAVPFLLELALQPAVQDRDVILALLIGMAEGRPYAPGQLEAVHAALAAGYEQIIRLLDDPSAQLHAGATYLLGFIPTRAADSLPLLHERFEQATTDLVERTALVMAIGLLTPAAPWLRHLVTADYPVAIRVAAALAIARANPTSLPDDVSTLIISVLKHPKEASEVLDQLPWDKDDVETACQEALEEAHIFLSKYR